MSKLDELYSQLNDLFTEFETNHQTNVNTGNKAAGTRARKAIGEVKKLVTEYRKDMQVVSPELMDLSQLIFHSGLNLNE